MTAGSRGHHVGPHRGGRIRRPPVHPADRDPERRDRWAHRGGGGGAALHHPPPRPARGAGPRDRPAQVARPTARLVPRAAGVGEVGPHPRAGTRSAQWSTAGVRSPSSRRRCSGSGSGCRRGTGGRRDTEAGEGLERALPHGRLGLSCCRFGCWWRLPRVGRQSQTASLRGLRTLSDSLRADPRVREVRSLVDLEPGTSLLAYSVLYSDLDAARRQYPDFVDAYLSRDRRLALLDVILADTTSLTSAMDWCRHARELGKAELRGTRGMTGGGRRLLRGGARFPGRPAARGSHCSSVSSSGRRRSCWPSRFARCWCRSRRSS